jgi:integrase
VLYTAAPRRPVPSIDVTQICCGSGSTRWSTLVEFALFTGLRRGEVLDLTWERVDRARGVMVLDVTKSDKRREVPLNSRADAVLARRGSKSGLVFGTRKWDRSPVQAPGARAPAQRGRPARPYVPRLRFSASFRAGDPGRRGSRSSCRCWCAWQESNLRPSD